MKPEKFYRIITCFYILLKDIDTFRICFGIEIAVASKLIDGTHHSI